MSKGKVFIGWTQSNELAKAVKKKLAAIGYEGIIGGKNGKDIRSHAVGQTVIDQMDKCCGAIMLFSERENTLSPNMLFELGYLSGSLRSNCILTIYIGIADHMIPSDLKGIWAETIDDLTWSDDKMADFIVNKFIEEQNIDDDYDKLTLISRYTDLKAKIINHQKPVYYNDEMAEFILLASHSAYIYNDISNLRDIINHVLENSDSIEIDIAAKCAMNYFDIHYNIKKNNFGTAKISKADYERIKFDYLDCMETVDELLINSEKFKAFFKMMCFNYLDFANVMYFIGLSKEEITEEFLAFKDLCYYQGIKYCNKLLELNSAANGNLVCLIKAYMNRSRAIFLADTDGERSNEYFEKSISERKKIYNKYKYKSTVDKNFLSQIEMEYFLALSDNIDCVQDDTVKSRRIEKLKSFLKREEDTLFNKMYNVNLIKERIK